MALAACGGRQRAAPPARTPLARPSRPAAASAVTARDHRRRRDVHLPLISKWSADYNAATGAKVNYQSIGSGGGIAQIKAGTVDFGSSDKPLSSEELAEAGLGQFPSAIGGVVPVVNLRGHRRRPAAPDRRRCWPTSSSARSRRGTTPAIAALNPGVALPAGKINIVHRSDGSGTTFNFTNYLSKVSPAVEVEVGEGTTVQWPGGVGGKGNEGVASYVKQIKGSIGYVELAYALQNNMAVRVAAERGRQLGAAQRGELRSRRRQRRLGQRTGLQPGHHQRAGRGRMADHRHQLHPDAQAAARMPSAAPTPCAFFKWALRERPGAGAASCTTCRCRRSWWSRSRRTGQPSSSDAAARASARLCRCVIPAKAGIARHRQQRHRLNPHQGAATHVPLLHSFRHALNPTTA